MKEKSSPVTSAIHKSISTIKNVESKIPLKHSRRWTRFPSGTILKAVRVVDVDYSAELMSLTKILKNAFCCKFAKYNSEMAIEFKIVQNFDDLNKIEKEEDYKNTNSIHNTDYGKNSLSEKSFYLPVEEDSQNEAIDLIPIAGMEKILKLNSLQTIKHFVDMDFNMSLLNLKVYVDNPFGETESPKKSTKSNSLFTDFLMKQNEYLQNDKLSSVYELFAYRDQCEILVGYDLEKEKIIFMPVRAVNSHLNNFIKISKPENLENLNINKFKSNFEFFIRAAELKIKMFDSDIMKLETNSTSKMFNSINQHLTIEKKPTIIHFADFINAELLEKQSCRKQSIVSVAPKASSSICLPNNDTGLSETLTSPQEAIQNYNEILPNKPSASSIRKTDIRLKKRRSYTIPARTFNRFRNNKEFYSRQDRNSEFSDSIKTGASTSNECWENMEFKDEPVFDSDQYNKLRSKSSLI